MSELRRRLLPTAAAILAAVLAGAGGAGLRAAEDPLKLSRMALDIAGYEDALRHLNRALADDPARKGVRALKGYAFYKLGQLDQALGELAKERERFPKNEDGWTLAAAVLYQKGNIGGAEELVRGYLAAFEKDVKGRLESPSIARVAKQAPNGGIPSFVLGRIAERGGRTEEAGFRFAEALRLGYDANACRARSVVLALRAGDFAGALKRALDTRDPALREGPELLTLEALALRGMGRGGDALPLLAAAADAAPFEDWALRNFAVGLIESGKSGEAMATLSAMLKLYPADFQARELFDLALNRRTPPSGSGALRYKDDFPDYDMPIYRYEFYQDPDELAMKVNAGSIGLIQAGETDLAAGFLHGFLDLHRNSPTLEYNLAQLYNARGVRLECLRHAWRAIDLKPDYRDAWDLAANALFRAGDYGGAVRLYRKAVELDDRDPEARYNLGCAQFGAGDTTGAEASWREAIVLESSAAPSPASRETAEAAKGGALDVRVKVRVNPISVPASMNLAKLYADTGRAEQAIDCLALVLELAPRNTEAYFELGRLRAIRNEAEAAAECFRKFVELGGDEARTRPYLKKKPPIGSRGFAQTHNLSSCGLSTIL